MTELDNLMLRIVGDTSSITASLKGVEGSMQNVAMTAVKTAEQMSVAMTTPFVTTSTAATASTAVTTASLAKTGDAATQTTAKVMSLSEAFTAMAKTAIGAFAALGAATSLKGMFDKFTDFEKGALRLNAAIEANGGSVEKAVPAYVKLASEIAKATVYTKGQVLGLAQMAESYGLTDEAARRAIKNAVALAAAKGGEADSYIRMTAALEGADGAEEGHAEMLRRLIPQLRDATSQTEMAEMAHKALAKMWKVAEAEGRGTAAQITKLQKSFAGLSIEIGGMVAQAVRPLVGWLKQSVDWFNSQNETLKLTAVYVLAASVGFVAFANTLPLIIAGLVTAKATLASWSAAIVASPLTGWGLAIGGAALALAGLSYAVMKSAGDIDALNNAMRDNAELQNQLMGRLSKGTSKIMTEAASIGNPQERKDFLEKELEKAKKELAGVQGRVDSERAKFANEGWGNYLGRMLVGWIPGLSDVAKAEKQALADAEEQAKGLRDQIGQISGALNKLNDQTSLKRLIRDIKEMEMSLQHQLDTVGMSENAIKRWELAERGASDAMLAVIDHMMLEIEAAEAAKKLDEEVTKLTASLWEQAGTFGMSSRQAEVYKLGMQGASESQLHWAQVLADVNDIMEYQQKLMESGAAVTKQFMTPREKLAERTNELQEMLKEGAINFATYQRAVLAARNSLNSFHNAVVKVSQVGTAEALGKLIEYEASFRPQYGESPNRFAANPAVESPAVNEAKTTNNILGRIERILAKEADKDTIEIEDAELV